MLLHAVQLEQLCKCWWLKPEPVLLISGCICWIVNKATTFQNQTRPILRGEDMHETSSQTIYIILGS